MIERHVTFNVYAEKASEFERLFAEKYRPAMASMPGFIQVDLLREAESATAYHMVIRFQDAETAAGWRASAAHQSLQPALKSLYSDSKLQVYEVVA